MRRDWRHPKPAPWYAVGLLLLSLLALLAALVDARTGRTMLEVAVVALVCPWVLAWAWSSRAAMELQARRGQYGPHAPVIAPSSEERHASRYGTGDRRRRNGPPRRADSRHSTPGGPGRAFGGRIWTGTLAGGAALRFRPVFKKAPGAPTGG
jgi:hypothetical protein